MANKLENASNAKRVYSIYDYFLTRKSDSTLEKTEISLILEHFLEVAKVPYKVGTFSYMLFSAIGPVICKQETDSEINSALFDFFGEFRY